MTVLRASRVWTVTMAIGDQSALEFWTSDFTVPYAELSGTTTSRRFSAIDRRSKSRGSRRNAPMAERTIGATRMGIAIGKGRQTGGIRASANVTSAQASITARAMAIASDNPATAQTRL